MMNFSVRASAEAMIERMCKEDPEFTAFVEVMRSRSEMNTVEELFDKENDEPQVFFLGTVSR